MGWVAKDETLQKSEGSYLSHHWHLIAGCGTSDRHTQTEMALICWHVQSLRVMTRLASNPQPWFRLHTLPWCSLEGGSRSLVCPSWIRNDSLGIHQEHPSKATTQMNDLWTSECCFEMFWNGVNALQLLELYTVNGTGHFSRAIPTSTWYMFQQNLRDQSMGRCCWLLLLSVTVLSVEWRHQRKEQS